MKLLLIGGHPKGHDIPFHPTTRSGKILRKIISEHNLNVKLLNLWENSQQEKAMIISKEIINQIKSHRTTHHIIALGRHQEKALLKHSTKCIYLPHPASWQLNDRKNLIENLIKLSRTPAYC